MSKYIDLAKRISDYTRTISLDVHMGVREALAYLDMFPDEVPGRTITESEFRKLYLGVPPYKDYLSYAKALAMSLGITVVPDPEPTNAGKLEADIRALLQEPSQSFSIARDLAEKLDTAGWTKAPGGDDE